MMDWLEYAKNSAENDRNELAQAWALIAIAEELRKLNQQIEEESKYIHAMPVEDLLR
jgi:hypothetical protein